MRTGFYFALLLMDFERRVEFRPPSNHLQCHTFRRVGYSTGTGILSICTPRTTFTQNLVGSNSRVFHLFVPPNLVIIGTVEVKAMHMRYLPPSPSLYPRENYSHPSPSPLPPHRKKVGLISVLRTQYRK